MSSRRTIILIVAIIVGIVAAAILFLYVNSVEENAEGDLDRVPVFIAQGEILRGESFAIAQPRIVSAEIPREFLPPTYIRNLDAISGLVAATPIASNQILVQGMFATPQSVSSDLTERIDDKGNVAISIQVDDVHGVAGLLTPGDKVNMMMIRRPENGEVSFPGLSAAPREGLAAAGMLFQEVRILAIGKTLRPDLGDDGVTQSGALGGGLITVEVPVDAAMRIALAMEEGGIYLSLVPEDFEAAPQAATGTWLTFDNLGLTPYPERNAALAEILGLVNATGTPTTTTPAAPTPADTTTTTTATDAP